MSNRRGQNSFEYVLLLAGVLAVVIIAVVVLRTGVLGTANQQISANLNTLLQVGSACQAISTLVIDVNGSNATLTLCQAVDPNSTIVYLYSNPVVFNGSSDQPINMSFSVVGGFSMIFLNVTGKNGTALNMSQTHCVDVTVSGNYLLRQLCGTAGQTSGAATPTPTPTPIPPAPQVTLNSPANGATIPNGTTFQYTPSSSVSYSNATLYGNFSGVWAANVSNASTVTNSTVNSLVTTVPPGNYLWNVQVCDRFANCSFAPANFSFTAQYNATWTQTTQADFQAGTPTYIDLASYPGNATLAKNNSNPVWTRIVNQSTPGVSAANVMVYDSSTGLMVAYGAPGGQTQPTWVYNRTSNVWTNVTPAVSPNVSSAMLAFDPVKNVTVLFGGYNGPAYRQDTWWYNSSTNTWTNVTLAGSPLGRGSAPLAFDSNRNVIVLFGGYNSSGPMNDTWEYSSSANTWTQRFPAIAPPIRWGHTMVFDATKNVTVMFGGYAYNDTWWYNSSSATWTNKTTAAFPPGRYYGGMAYDPSIQASILFGGYNYSNSGGTGHLGDTWRYNATTNVWTQLFPVTGPIARDSFGYAYDDARRVFTLYGGQTATGQVEDVVYYNASTNTWAQIAPNGPPPRYLTVMAFDSRKGASVLFGGTNGGPSNASWNDTWLFNSTSRAWTEVTPAFSPPAQYYSSLSYDSARGLTLLFGGGIGTPAYNETWLFNSTSNTWTNASPVLAPAVRWMTATAFDSWHNVTILFSGQTNSGNPSDTWAYNSTSNTWTQLFPAVSPPGRIMHRLAFDSVRGVIVMFGWFGSSVTDTWEYNYTSNTWTNRTQPIAPPARGYHGMAFDSDRNVTVLFGGFNASSVPLGDTWEYNSTTANWTQIISPVDSRGYMAMDYDPTVHAALMFGGMSSTFAIVGDVQKYSPAYYSSSSLASQVFDAGQNASWFLLNWSQALNASTNVSLQTRTCTLAACADNPAYSAGLSCAGALCSWAVPSTSGRRYIQWQANLTTTDTANTPVLSEVNTTYGIPG